jgi:hypothetical protein
LVEGADDDGASGAVELDAARAGAGAFVLAASALVRAARLPAADAGFVAQIAKPSNAAQASDSAMLRIIVMLFGRARRRTPYQQT